MVGFRTRLGAAALLAGLAGATLAAAMAIAGSDPARLASQGLPEAGVPPCAACHGAKGEGLESQGAPRLAGLNAGYIGAQLDAFRSGRRKYAMMNAVAHGLSPDQSAALAAYYASLPPPAAPPVSPAASTQEALGRDLALRGNWAKGVPPCAACHAPDGLGVGAVTPALAGQGRAYLLGELRRFASGERAGDPLGLMRAVAGRLTPAQMRAVAAYYASRPAGANTDGGPS
jgi:cytochrome c553